MEDVRGILIAFSCPARQCHSQFTMQTEVISPMMGPLCVNTHAAVFLCHLPFACCVFRLNILFSLDSLIQFE